MLILMTIQSDKALLRGKQCLQTPKTTSSLDSNPYGNILTRASQIPRDMDKAVKSHLVLQPELKKMSVEYPRAAKVDW
jgi:hypothetical protein